MGCELSKLATVKSQTQTATDPRLPLTARQKFTVTASWKAVSRALEPTGVYMLIRSVATTSFSIYFTFYHVLSACSPIAASETFKDLFSAGFAFWGEEEETSVLLRYRLEVH